MRRPVQVVVALGVLVAAGCSADDGQRSAPALVVIGYVAPWDPRSRAALEDPPDGVVELSPVWYQPTETGEVTVVSGDARAQMEAPAPAGDRDGDVRLVPSVSNFRAGRWDGQLVTAILDDPATRRTHIEALVAAAREPGVAGLDIDYESLDGEHRDAYSAFVRDLARALHDVDRTLSVTVHAKTAEPGDWPGAEAQDWRAIGDAADGVRVMAYDHSWAGSPAGPVAPSAWVEEVARFATSQMAPDKVVLGLPTYGYDWVEAAGGDAVAWEDAVALVASHGAVRRWDDESESPWFTYTGDDGRAHTVWYEDARSLAAKVDVARRHDVGGVFLWKLGGEDPAIWEVLDAAARR